MLKNKVSFKAILIAAVSCLSLNSFANENQEGVTASVTNEGAERYPVKIIDRPGIMPTGIFQVTLDSKFSKDPETKRNKVGLDISTEFGIAKNLQGSVSWDGVEFNKVEGKTISFQETVNLKAVYQYFSMPHFSTKVALGLPVYVTKGIEDFTIGLPTTFYNDLMVGQLFKDIFNLKMRPNVEMAFNFKWTYGLQVFGDLWAQVDSSFGNIKMTNEDKKQAKWTGTAFWKELPAELTLIYALNHYFDVGAHVGGKFNFGKTSDPKDMKFKDTLNFGVNLAVRGGKIFG